MPQEPEILRERGRNLEDEFFHRADQQLLARLRAAKAVELTRENLSKASGVTDPAVLDHMIALGIQPPTLAALSLVPLVEVAWADDMLDAKERRVTLDRAREAGVREEGMALLMAWLDRRPNPELFELWERMVKSMRAQLRPDEVAQLKTALLGQARAVAAASGGVLGVGRKISTAEAAVLQRLEAAFG
jgi:hypothetical protein